MKLYFILILVLFSSNSFCQEKAFSEEELSITNWIDGTLLSPKGIEKPSLVIIIADYGPTNRNGNQNFQKNNALKKLAEGLTLNAIATFRYDKRIVKQIRQGKVANDIMFDDYINDALAVIDYFKQKDLYSKIFVVGHGQGSLIGMLAARENVDGFISLAGTSSNIGDVLVDEATKMDPKLGKETKKVVDILKLGEATTDYPQALQSFFGPDIQDFMMNWMQYNPTEIIKELDLPILIINGTKDLQVSEKDANLLKDENEKASLIIIENMNHVLFEIKGDDLDNSKSYNESYRAVSPLLIESITNFVKS